MSDRYELVEVVSECPIWNEKKTATKHNEQKDDHHVPSQNRTGHPAETVFSAQQTEQPRSNQNEAGAITLVTLRPGEPDSEAQLQIYPSCMEHGEEDPSCMEHGEEDPSASGGPLPTKLCGLRQEPERTARFHLQTGLSLRSANDKKRRKKNDVKLKCLSRIR